MADESRQYGSEILTSIQKQIEQRLSSPLVGTFIISWCAINYRFLLILVSENSVTQKVTLLQTVAYPSLTELLTKTVLAPLAATVAYIFLLPFPEKFVFRYTRMRQREISTLQNEIEGNTLLTLEESQAIRLSARKLEILHKERIKELTTEIEEKNLIIEELNQQIKDMSSLNTLELADNPPPETDSGKSTAPTKPINQPNGDEIEILILQKLAESGETMLNSIYSAAPAHRVRIQRAIDDLKEGGIITTAHLPRLRDTRISLTATGRKFVIEHGLA